MLKRFFLFAGDSYYPSGGWGDFHADFDTLEEARVYVDTIQFDSGCRMKSFREYFDWHHILDSQTGEMV